MIPPNFYKSPQPGRASSKSPLSPWLTDGWFEFVFSPMVALWPNHGCPLRFRPLLTKKQKFICALRVLAPRSIWIPWISPWPPAAPPFLSFQLFQSRIQMILFFPISDRICARYRSFSTPPCPRLPPSRKRHFSR